MKKDFIVFIITVAIAIVVFFNMRPLVLAVNDLISPKKNPTITYSRIVDGIEIERPFGLEE